MTAPGVLCCFHHLRLGPAVTESKLRVSINAEADFKPPPPVPPDGRDTESFPLTRRPKERRQSSCHAVVKYPLTIDTRRTSNPLRTRPKADYWKVLVQIVKNHKQNTAGSPEPDLLSVLLNCGIMLIGTG